MRCQDEKKYERMTTQMKRATTGTLIEKEMSSIRQHLSIGLNMIVAQITGFIALYMVAKTITADETTRLLAGLAGLIGIMVIEMILHIVRSAKLDRVSKSYHAQETKMNKKKCQTQH